MALDEPKCEIHLDNDTSTLHLAKETTDLAAFQWKVPTPETSQKSNLIMYLVFEDEQTHLISLEPDKGEKPFRRVQSLTQRKLVQILSDEDIQLYLKDSELSNDDLETLLKDTLKH